MRPLRHALWALAVGVLSGCGSTQPPARAAADAASPRVASAAAMARTGQGLHGAARADVLATLGPATVLRFDSGYEVWVYRFDDAAPRRAARGPDPGSAPRGPVAGDGSASELVLLLAPSGVVAKSRVRTPS